MSEIIDYVQGSGMVLGSGYDLLGRSEKFSPFDPVSKVTEGPGPAEFELSFIETSSQLGTFLDVSAEGCFDSPVFSASAKARFTQETQLNEYNLYFLVHARCVKNVEIIDRPKLSQQAMSFISSGNFVAFFNSFGNYFVNAVSRGGEIFGMIRINTRSALQKQEISAEMDVGSICWDTRSNFLSKLAKYESSKVVDVMIKVNGLTNYSTPTTPSDLLKFVKSLPRLVEAAGTPIKVELRPISEMPEYQGAVLTLDDATRYALLQLSNHHLDYEVLRNNIKFMLSPAGASRFDFDSVNKDVVTAERDKVAAKLREIEVLYDSVLRNKIRPDDVSITQFRPAYEFDNTLHLPNLIETVQIPDRVIFPLTHTRGDTDIGGHSPKISIDATLTSRDSRHLTISVHMKIKESKPDWTTFEGDWGDTVFNLENTGLKIVDFRPRVGSVSAQAGEDDHEWHIYLGTGLIREAKCISDVEGKETGKIGANPICFNPVKVIVAPLNSPAPVAPIPLVRLAERRMAMAKYWLKRVR